MGAIFAPPQAGLAALAADIGPFRHE